MPPKNKGKKKVPPAVMSAEGGVNKPSRKGNPKDKAAKDKLVVLAVDCAALGAPYNRLVGDVVVQLAPALTVAEARARVGASIALAVEKLTGKPAPFAVPPRLFLRMSYDENDAEVEPVELDDGALADAGLEPTDFEYLAIAKPGKPTARELLAAAAVPPALAGAVGRSTRATAAAAAEEGTADHAPPRRRGAGSSAAAPARLRGDPTPGVKISAYQARVAAAEEAAARGEFAPLPPQKKRTRWTEEEDTALINGVRVYGPGQWKIIWERAGGATGALGKRSQVDLKDRWRNINKKAEREAAALE